mmetsp:Transcript_7383/g.13122  ORF Transcript_7383/g.13122 Transcript_7383/m.13122 type:complete len:85 (-) Transcript_7383:33-287(-)
MGLWLSLDSNCLLCKLQPFHTLLRVFNKCATGLVCVGLASSVKPRLPEPELVLLGGPVHGVVVVTGFELFAMQTPTISHAAAGL